MWTAGEQRGRAVPQPAEAVRNTWGNGAMRNVFVAYWLDMAENAP